MSPAFVAGCWVAAFTLIAVPESPETGRVGVASRPLRNGLGVEHLGGFHVEQAS
jgi:hypothetical protein